jgi:Holliday junction resolvase
MTSDNRQIIGLIGERIAISYLEELGFKVSYIARSKSLHIHPDILAEKEGRRYAIEVKNTMNGSLQIRDSNVKGLLKDSKATPCIFFINTNRVLFFMLNKELSKRLTRQMIKEAEESVRKKPERIRRNLTVRFRPKIRYNINQDEDMRMPHGHGQSK